MTAKTPKTRRWLQSAIATAAKDSTVLPFQRGKKRSTQPLHRASPVRPSSIAAH